MAKEQKEKQITFTTRDSLQREEELLAFDSLSIENPHQDEDTEDNFENS